MFLNYLYVGNLVQILVLLHWATVESKAVDEELKNHNELRRKHKLC